MHRFHDWYIIRLNKIQFNTRFKPDVPDRYWRLFRRTLAHAFAGDIDNVYACDYLF